MLIPPHSDALWAVRAQQRRGGKSKMQRLLNFQSGLCETCGLTPSRLMQETAAASLRTVKRLRKVRRRFEVKTDTRVRRRGGVEDGEKTLTSREYTTSMLWCPEEVVLGVGKEEGLGVGREEGLGVWREEVISEPDARLWRCREEGWGRRGEVGEPVFCPPCLNLCLLAEPFPLARCGRFG